MLDVCEEDGKGVANWRSRQFADACIFGRKLYNEAT
jgi:hypothetical protein